jgi:hypothetical protein
MSTKIEVGNESFAELSYDEILKDEGTSFTVEIKPYFWFDSLPKARQQELFHHFKKARRARSSNMRRHHVKRIYLICLGEIRSWKFAYDQTVKLVCYICENMAEYVPLKLYVEQLEKRYRAK